MSALTGRILGDPLRLRGALSLLLTVLSAVSVRVGGGGSDLAYAGAALAIALAYRKPPSVPSPAAKRLWTLGVFVALVASIWRGLSQSAIIDSGTDFLLLLFVQRFFQRAKTREHQQILLLSGVMMVVAAVINVEVSFPLILLLYLPCMIFALVINLLVGEGERLGPRVMYDLERIGETRVARIARVSVQVAGIVCAASLAVFVFFPRFGAGVFLRGSIPTRTVSGFSDQVQLGTFGKIKDDPTVVMRVETEDAPPNATELDWYFRGAVLDTYENRRWSFERASTRVSLEYQCGYRLFLDGRRPRLSPSFEGPGRCSHEPNPIQGFERSTQLRRASITVEDLGVDLLFVPDRPAAVALDHRGLLERRYRINLRGGERVEVQRRQPGPLIYRTISQGGVARRDELARVSDEVTRPPDVSYLQVPTVLGAEFRALADRLAEGRSGRIERVEAVLDHLRGFEYSLDLEAPPADDPRDPVEFFLFETQSGHCELFASSAALLLRKMGVETRIVNGYLGAKLNEFGGFYTVTQANAHSWIEVNFEELGWIRFDPTPSSGRRPTPRNAIIATLSAYLDALRNNYLIYIIDYDLKSQLQILSSAGVSWSGRSGGFDVDRERVGLVLSILAVLIAGGFLWVRRRAPDLRSRATRAFAEVEATLQSRGAPRRPEETALAFVTRVAELGFPEPEALRDLGARFEKLRYGPGGGDAHDDELEALSKRVRLAAKRWKVRR